MTSPVDVCNIALLRLGAKPIAALTDDSKQGRFCNRIYNPARKSELRAYAWNFARGRAALAANADAPAFGFANAYPLPNDFLRLIPNITATDWQIEGKEILTDDGTPLQIEYIKDVTDANIFDDLFVDLLAARIARELAEPLTQSNAKIETAEAKYLRIKAEAKKLNSFENVARDTPQESWITARL